MRGPYPGMKESLAPDDAPTPPFEPLMAPPSYLPLAEHWLEGDILRGVGAIMNVTGLPRMRVTGVQNIPHRLR